MREQLRELTVEGIALDLADEPARCGRCNDSVEHVAEDEASPEYVPNPGKRRIWRCVECGQHFWKGSHWKRVETMLSEL